MPPQFRTIIELHVRLSRHPVSATRVHGAGNGPETPIMVLTGVVLAAVAAWSAFPRQADGLAGVGEDVTEAGLLDFVSTKVSIGD